MSVERRRVLVPAAAAQLLRTHVPEALEILSYRYSAHTVTARAARRVGLLGDAEMLGRTFAGSESTPWELIDSLWLGAEVQLSMREARVLAERMPALSQVYWQRTGLDGLPIAAFESRGVRVVGSGELTSRWVAETVIACIVADAKFLTLAARDRVPALDRFTRGFEGLRVAVVGTGRIGSSVAQQASALGMRVTGIARDPGRADASRASFAELRRFPNDLVTAAQETDYLVLALPSTETTRGLVDAGVIGALGPSGVLVNLARPDIVDQESLLRALRRGALRAAYVSRLEARSLWSRARGLPPNLFLTHNREAHVAEKLDRAAQQFARML